MSTFKYKTYIIKVKTSMIVNFNQILRELSYLKNDKY